MPTLNRCLTIWSCNFEQLIFRKLLVRLQPLQVGLIAPIGEHTSTHILELASALLGGSGNLQAHRRGEQRRLA